MSAWVGRSGCQLYKLKLGQVRLGQIGNYAALGNDSYQGASTKCGSKQAQIEGSTQF